MSMRNAIGGECGCVNCRSANLPVVAKKPKRKGK